LCLFLEFSKSQNDMTSEKHLLAMGSRQCVGQTERRSQSDTAVNVTSRVSSGLLGLCTDHLHIVIQSSPACFSIDLLLLC
jgi:synaptotagmin-like protein